MYTDMLTSESVPRPFTEQPENVLVCLLGSFRLILRGEPLNLVFAGKAMALLSELGLHLSSGVSREGLLEMLWPEQDAASSTVSLNSLVYSVQRRLRRSAHGSAAVVYVNGSYYLNVAAGVSTDVAHFDALVNRGNQLAAAGQHSTAAMYRERAVNLYRGDLCLGTDIHAVIERERLRASFLTLLAWLADRTYQTGDDIAALDFALRLLSCDPCREDAHRMVMRVHVRRGERAQALRQYRICEQVLQLEFGAAPEPATRALFDLIRSVPVAAGVAS